VSEAVYALIAGREAKDGVSMGNAGVLVFAEASTLVPRVTDSAVIPQRFQMH
jgi:succinyl-CoA synthetase alpha subunit